MPDTTASTFDWQGHRGARGLMPENTIPAFLRALSFPEIVTLELDVVISADDRVIVSHDPWMEKEICQTEAGGEIVDTIKIRNLSSTEVAGFDCGLRPNPKFPAQTRRPAHKPTLAAVFAAVDRYCVQRNRPSPRYNIELKYQSDWEPQLVPGRGRFVELVMADIDAWGKPELVTLQCFDPPLLAVIYESRPEIRLAYLDENPGDLSNKLAALGFVPSIYSPWHVKLTDSIITEAKEFNMRIIPWTVNEVSRMRELIEAGVDGIITDHPDRIATALSL